jgi:hypothetical protein
MYTSALRNQSYANTYEVNFDGEGDPENPLNWVIAPEMDSNNTSIMFYFHLTFLINHDHACPR